MKKKKKSKNAQMWHEHFLKNRIMNFKCQQKIAH